MTQRGTRSAVQDPQHEHTDCMCVFRCASQNTRCASRSCVPTQLQTRYGLLDRTYPQNADETVARHGQPAVMITRESGRSCVNFTV